MNSKQTNNFFIHSSLSGVPTALLQKQKKQFGYFHRLINASLLRQTSLVEGVEQLARQLLSIAHQAYFARQIEAVEAASQILLAMPISEELKGAALYYEALCMKQRGDIENARRLLERVAEDATTRYRARALQCIGAIYYESGEIDEALPFYLIAGKVATNCDLLTIAESQGMIAAIRGIQGDSKQAIDGLERAFPLIHLVGKSYPAFYYDCLNNFAVELAEGGRTAEAKAAINIALASPYASIYPIWSETRDEIEQKRNYPNLSHCFIDRSFTESEAIPQTDTDLSPAVERQPEAAPSTQAQAQVEAKPFRAVAFHRFVNQSIYQRPVTLPKAVKATIPGGSAKSFLLQRLGRCVQSRAPPAI